MAAAGAKVVVVGRRETELQQACVEIGANASYVPFDVTHVDKAPELITKAAKAAGSPVSILVNNAGIHLKKLAVDTTPEEFQTVLTTHVCAAHAISRAALPGMIERKHGNILFTASMTTFIGMPLVIAYTSAKSALGGMTRALAAEASPHGIRVNSIAPGWIDSAMTRKALNSDPQRKAKVLGRTPMARLGQADDIGWAAVYLCSPSARFVTGVVLPVDGGALIGF